MSKMHKEHTLTKNQQIIFDLIDKFIKNSKLKITIVQ